MLLVSEYSTHHMLIENDFVCTPNHTPTISPLSSPPRIERLRLFDTPHTPKTLLRRSSMSEREEDQPQEGTPPGPCITTLPSRYN